MSSMTPNPIPLGATVSGNCELHKTHHPEPTYLELHHVIPQQWQAFLVKAAFVQPLSNWPLLPDEQAKWPYAGKSPDHPGLILWDARTDPICRTGHGNTHFYLVKLMHWATERTTHTDFAAMLEYSTTLLRHTFKQTDPPAVREAVQAMSRVQAVLGEEALYALAAGGQWGQI